MAASEQSKRLVEKKVTFNPDKVIRRIEFAVSGPQRHIRGLRLYDEGNELLTESIWSEEAP